MKILYISFRINASDGSSVHGRAFVEQASRLGHEVMVYPPMRPIVPDVPSGKRQAKTPLYFLRKLNWETLKGNLRELHRYIGELVDLVDGFVDGIREYRDLTRMLTESRPDIVVYRQQMFHLGPLWACKRLGVPCVLEVNAIRSIEASAWNRGKPVSLLTRWAERAPFQHVSHVVAVSNEVKEYIDRLIGPSSSTVVPNGVDTAKFDPKRFDMEAVKRQLGLQGKTVLGYSGSYKAWHGLDITLDVMARLRKSNDRYHLLLIGTGECYREFGRAVDQRGLRSLVTQIPQVSHEEMPRYLAAFDYALMTYPAALRFYFSPLKMFEYLAMGIPVIATKVGQIAEVISAGEIGYLVDPPTAENFAQAVLAAEDDPLRLASIRANARKLMAAKYSWRANAEQVIGVCARVLGRER